MEPEVTPKKKKHNESGVPAEDEAKSHMTSATLTTTPVPNEIDKSQFLSLESRLKQLEESHQKKIMSLETTISTIQNHLKTKDEEIKKLSSENHKFMLRLERVEIKQNSSQSVKPAETVSTPTKIADKIAKHEELTNTPKKN